MSHTPGSSAAVKSYFASSVIPWPKPPSGRTCRCRIATIIRRQTGRNLISFHRKNENSTKKADSGCFFCKSPKGENHGSVKSNMTVQMQIVKRIPAKISARSRSKNPNARMNRDCFLRQAPVRRHHRADAGNAPGGKPEAGPAMRHPVKKSFFFSVFHFD